MTKSSSTQNDNISLIEVVSLLNIDSIGSGRNVTIIPDHQKSISKVEVGLVEAVIPDGSSLIKGSHVEERKIGESSKF